MIKFISKIITIIIGFTIMLITLALYDIGSRVEMPEKQVLSPTNTENYNRFDTIMKYTFIWEAGYQCYSTDRGNWSTDSVLCGTKYGISTIAYENYFGYVNQQCIKYLDTATAQKIYLDKFYLPIKIYKIKDNAVAHLIFDTYIASPGTCRRILTIALGTTITTPLQDSIVDKINKIEPHYLFNEILKLRYEHIEKISVQYPQFKKGWINRLKKINNLYYE